MNRITAAANAGTNHLRSLGLRAGRKNARICHRITGEHVTTDAHRATLKLVANASNGSSAVSTAVPSDPCGRYSAMGSSRNWISVGAAK